MGVWVLLSAVLRAGVRQVELLRKVLDGGPASGPSSGTSSGTASGTASGTSSGPASSTSRSRAEGRRWETAGPLARSGGAGEGSAAAAGRPPITSSRVSSASEGRNAPIPGPTLSVIVAARDEAVHIESTVRGLLAQRDPGLQIVVVDDRSSDGTGAILDRIGLETGAPGRLEVVHNVALPPGWLGKCHACHLGASRARGDWLLFMDGDVTLASDDVLRRVVAFARERGLDHVAVIPDMGPMGPLQSALVGVFGQVFLLATRAHEMDRDLPRGGGGVGAFNLVTREAYARIGGHTLLRMDPGDDVKLGSLLKGSGARQRIYHGRGLVTCPWQSGALGVVRGLEKNAFSGCYYSPSVLILLTAVSLWFTFAPLLSAAVAAALAMGEGSSGPFGWARLGAGLAPLLVQIGLMVAGWATQGRRLGVPLSAVALYPVGVLLLLAAAWNSAIRALWRGGIEWRGTFYPLEALRSGLVRPGDGAKLRERRTRS